MTRPKVTGTQSIRRATLLMKTIAAHNQVGIRLTDLASYLPLDRTTIHRIVKSLVAEGFIAQDSQSRRFYLGQTLFELGLGAAQRFNLRDVYRPILERIAEKTGDTVFLNIRSDNEVVCIERQQGAYPVRVLTVDVGGRRPLGTSASGIAILSALSDEKVKEIIAEIESSKHTMKPLRVRKILECIRQAREKGYVVHESEIVDIRAMAVVVKDKNGNPWAAIGVTAISSRMTDTRLREVAGIVKNAARELENLLVERLHA